MKLFLLEPTPKDVEALGAMKLCDGVVVTDAGGKKPGAWLDRVEGPVCVALAGVAAKGRAERARDVADLGDRAVAHVPMGPDALLLAAQAYEEGVPVFVDGCVDALEALGAAKALATYVGVSLRGAAAGGRDALKVLDDVVGLVERYELEAQVVATDVESAHQLLEAALTGVSAAVVDAALARTLAGRA
ncbi:MAG: hypothetical protein KC635_24230 [Myxococcales bacterium]|nr:hypothetical protein [Myxococcales bacterium]MCB9733033.1 hypothetical protein [Deltaproteobacteria bacterium]